jgi:hypothetical protein
VAAFSCYIGQIKPGKEIYRLKKEFGNHFCGCGKKCHQESEREKERVTCKERRKTRK